MRTHMASMPVALETAPHTPPSTRLSGLRRNERTRRPRWWWWRCWCHSDQGPARRDQGHRQPIQPPSGGRHDEDAPDGGGVGRPPSVSGRVPGSGASAIPR